MTAKLQSMQSQMDDLACTVHRLHIPAEEPLAAALSPQRPAVRAVQHGAHLPSSRDTTGQCSPDEPRRAAPRAVPCSSSRAAASSRPIAHEAEYSELSAAHHPPPPDNYTARRPSPQGQGTPRHRPAVSPRPGAATALLGRGREDHEDHYGAPLSPTGDAPPPLDAADQSVAAGPMRRRPVLVKVHSKRTLGAGGVQ